MTAFLSKQFHSVLRHRLIKAVLSCCLLLTAGCGTNPPKRPALTLLVYLCGSSLESLAGSASADLEEMREALRQNEALEIFVLAGGAKEWKTEDIDPSSYDIVRLTVNGLEPVEEGSASASLMPLSMGNAETLSRLLDYGYAHGSGERFALLLWDHGAGPMGGLCYDEHYAAADEAGHLSLSELNEALRTSPFQDGKRFSWIGMDACLMASLETAEAVYPYADYLFGSEELEPDTGWDYSFLSRITDSIGTQDIARLAGEAYLSSSETLADRTFSCIDLVRAHALSEALGEVFADISVNAETYPDLMRARVMSRESGHRSPWPYDLVDLGSLLQEMRDFDEDGMKRLEDLLEQAVVVNMSNHAPYCGLSVYVPFYNKAGYLSPWSSDYSRSSISAGYRSFVASLGGILLEEAHSAWSTPGNTETDDSGTVFLELDAEQAEHFASARLVVLDENMAGSYYRSYLGEAVSSTEAGVLYCDYHNEALYFLDETGAPDSGAMTYWLLDDAVAIPCMVYNREESVQNGKPRVPDGHVYDETAMPFLLVFAPGEDGRYHYMDLLEYDPDSMTLGKSVLRLEDWDMVRMLAQGRTPVKDEAGNLLPFLDWDTTTVFYGYEEETAKLGDCVFLPRMDDSRRFVSFEITDVYGNTHMSELRELANPYRMELPVRSLVLAEEETFHLLLESVAAVSAEDPGLRLVMEAENRTSETMIVWLRSFLADEMPLSENEDQWFSIPPETALVKEIRLSADLFAGINKDTVDHLKFEITAGDGFLERNIHYRVPADLPLKLDLRAMRK